MIENINEVKSLIKAKELIEQDIYHNEDIGSFESLALIHKYIFDGVDPQAGKLRETNCIKEEMRFVSPLYLKEAVLAIEKMPQSTFDEIIEKYVEMNIAHPFNDGNGRSMRIWLNLILKKEIKQVIDYSQIEKMMFFQAMEKSIINTIDLKILLSSALTDQIEDVDIFIKGIYQSFFYEVYDFNRYTFEKYSK